jgi:hypothetical protein
VVVGLIPVGDALVGERKTKEKTMAEAIVFAF